MSNFDWKSLIRNIAPTAATLLGGPAAGLVTKGLLAAFDPEKKVDPNDPAQVDQLMQNVVLDPASVVKIQQIEADLKAHMADLGFQNEKDIRDFNLKSAQTEVDDRASARQREMGVRDIMPKLLAGAAVAGALAVSGIIITGHATAMKDATTAALAGSIVGYLFNEVKQVYSYYFGSSSGSDRKTELLAQAPPVDSQS